MAKSDRPYSDGLYIPHHATANEEGAQEKKLSGGEIKALEDAGIDIHELKGGKNWENRFV